MKDYLSLGAVPCNEDCVQVNRDADYYPAMRAQAKVYKEQLERMFPEQPDGAYLTVKTFPHDFGSYCEVCVVFDSDNEAACEYAYNLENNTPECWDEEARKEPEHKGGV